MRFDGIDPFGLKGGDLLKFRRRVQMVFQDPYASLNSRMTAGDIIAEPWRSHEGMYKNRKDRDMRVRGLLDLVGLGAKAADKYSQEFSGGQRQRIGVARALALDLSVQAQVLNLLNLLQQQLQISYVFISHDLSVVRHVADRVSVMYLGRIIESGPTQTVFEHPNHPCTAALMSAAPKLDSAERKDRILLEGEVPSPIDPPSGCRLRQRDSAIEDLAGQPDRVRRLRTHRPIQLGPVPRLRIHRRGRHRIGPRDAARHGLAWVGDTSRLDALLRESDVVAVSAPLSERTRGVIGADQLRALGPNGVLINVGRGPLIDERAVFEALQQRDIRAAAIDVWYQYPSGPEEKAAPATLPSNN